MVGIAERLECIWAGKAGAEGYSARGPSSRPEAALGHGAGGYIGIVFKLLSVSNKLQHVRKALSISNEPGQQCAGNANFHMKQPALGAIFSTVEKEMQNCLRRLAAWA